MVFFLDYVLDASAWCTMCVSVSSGIEFSDLNTKFGNSSLNFLRLGILGIIIRCWMVTSVQKCLDVIRENGSGVEKIITKLKWPKVQSDCLDRM